MADNLHDTRFLLKSLMENMPDNIYFKDVDSRFIMVNQAFCDWCGQDLVDVIGRTDFDLFAQAHAERSRADEQRIMASGEPMVAVEEQEVWPDGRTSWCSTTKMALQNEEDETIGIFGVSRDITEHKEAELQAALYAEQVRGIKESMEKDVRMAAELQKTFFPRSYPTFPPGVGGSENCVEFSHYYNASGMVSGDFCTIRRLSDTKAGIFLCDVMGHGVRAALGTALICAIIEELSPVAMDPGRFLGRMNELLLPMLRQEDMLLFASACYMVFDASTGWLSIANAGHPSPVLIGNQGAAVSWLMDDATLRGCALAIMEGAVYENIERQLEPGDSVMVYTDGLYEVERAGGEEFGEERVLEAIRNAAGMPLKQLFPALTQEACKFAEHGELDDDVCMVGLHYKHPLV